MSITQSPIIFLVDGNPLPKQSFRFVHGGGYTHPRVKAWQDTVMLRSREVMQDKVRLAGPVSVRLVFVLKHQRKVDCDNLSKAVLDAMNGIVYVDDSLVCNLHIVKHVMPKAEPGVMIEVHLGEVLPFMQEWNL